MKVGIAICGDPKRYSLAESLFQIYSDYKFIDSVYLYYRENPAKSFNLAAKEMDSDIFIGIAGDVYIGESELFSLIEYPSQIVCAFSPLTPRKRDVFGYPKWWSSRNDWGFISGLFKIPRELLLKYPFVEEPSFVEDSFFDRTIRQAGYSVVSFQVPCVHIDYHDIFRKRTFTYLIIPERKGKTIKQVIKNVVKILGYEWQEIWAAIKRKEITERNRWEYEMQYKRKVSY